MFFRNEYAFLSNMYLCPVHYDGKIFPCVETGFQYAKCENEEEHSKFLDKNNEWVTGRIAKSIGRHVKLRNDWNTYRVEVMKELLEDKFLNNPTLREALKVTGRIELVEENDWGDMFWGVCNGKGNNMLGKLLTEIRDRIQKEDGYPLKVIVAGSRSFNDYYLLCKRLDFYLKDVKSPVIVSGKARGADALGEKYAIEHNLPGESYPADWSKGKAAGYIRNEEMAKNADVLVAFWNGTSKGTEHMIKTMKKLNKPVRVVKYA